MTATLFYSLDGQTFTALEPIERAVEHEEQMFNVGLEGVHKVQLLLSKEAADASTGTQNQHAYVFSLDSFAVYTDEYSDDATSELYAGPYQVQNAQGEDVMFTKATLSACTTEPEDTGVSFYLSKDGVEYTAVSFDDEGLGLVSFGNGDQAQSEGFIDSGVGATTLVESVDGVEEIDFADEATINTYILASFASAVPVRSVTLKRNVPGADSPDTLLKAAPGWVFDTNTNQYMTTVYVDAQEGRYLDLGSTSAIVNGAQQSGQVFLPQGTSTLATTDSNWRLVDSGATSVSALEALDPLYPYNHKYLVEGYTYGSGFTGEQIYTGVDEYFGRRLIYVAPELFAFLEPEDDEYWNSFTLEQVDGNLYFKVKVDKTDATWLSELIVPTWSVQSANDSNLYVKAVLSSSSTDCTPVIDKFSVRVI